MNSQEKKALQKVARMIQKASGKKYTEALKLAIHALGTKKPGGK